jgi:hypothetical protein
MGSPIINVPNIDVQQLFVEPGMGNEIAVSILHFSVPGRPSAMSSNCGQQ